MVLGFYMPSTYVLQSQKNNSLYIGSCVNIDERFRDHNRGNTTYTKRLIPWELLYQEESATLAEARARERQLKKWKSKERIIELIKRPRDSKETTTS